MLTRNLIRAARALLGWEQRDLSRAAGLAEGTIQRMERVGPERSRAENVNKVQKALENGGIVFIRDLIGIAERAPSQMRSSPHPCLRCICRAP